VVGGEVPPADWIEQRPWSLRRQADDLAEFDIGVMPLPDTDWARGKCGYKLLQYFAAGVPAVASPVGVSRTLLGDERGIPASTQDDWHAALDQLTRSATERAERGAAARKFAEREFSYQRWAPELASLMQSLG
jgi:glycosyltransferase involved in cell wall biosynthesis